MTQPPSPSAGPAAWLRAHGPAIALEVGFNFVAPVLVYDLASFTCWPALVHAGDRKRAHRRSPRSAKIRSFAGR